MLKIMPQHSNLTLTIKVDTVRSTAVRGQHTDTNENFDQQHLQHKLLNTFTIKIYIKSSSEQSDLTRMHYYAHCPVMAGSWGGQNSGPVFHQRSPN